MLRIAGLGSYKEGASTESSEPEGVLVEFHGCRVLVGCPLGTAADLSQLGVTVADVDAVLLTCARSLSGWPEFEPLALPIDGPVDSCQRPRTIGTAPVLLAAESCLLDEVERGSEGATSPSKRTNSRQRLTRADILAVFAHAEEVSWGQEVTIDGTNGQIIAIPASSGYGLGGSYWVLEAFGIRVVVAGPLSLADSLAPHPLDCQEMTNADVFIVLDTAKVSQPASESTAGALASAAEEATKVLEAGSCVLVPIGADLALCVDVVEKLGHAIASLPSKAQAPIFVIGGPGRFLRRCGCFIEWAHPSRATCLHVGHAPFAIDGLLRSRRLELADDVPSLAKVYQEPCVVIASAESSKQGATAHFRKLWANQDGARTLVVDPAVSIDAMSDLLRFIGAPIELRLAEDTVKTLIEDIAPAFVVLHGSTSLVASADQTAIELTRARRVSVPIDERMPASRCWLAAAAVQAAEARLSVPISSTTDGEQGSSICRLDGVLLGSKRRRIVEDTAPEPIASPLLVGKVDLQRLLSALITQGHPGTVATERTAKTKGGRSRDANLETVEVSIPSLEARVQLNLLPTRGAAGVDGQLETMIEAPSRDARRFLTEVLENLLVQL